MASNQPLGPKLRPVSVTVGTGRSANRPRDGGYERLTKPSGQLWSSRTLLTPRP
jgi:hypothetical protein